jgi:hypothetical protein
MVVSLVLSSSPSCTRKAGVCDSLRGELVGMPGVEPGITCSPCTHVYRYTTSRIFQSTQQDLNPRFGTWQGRMLPSYIMGAWLTDRVVKDRKPSAGPQGLEP